MKHLITGLIIILMLFLVACNSGKSQTLTIHFESYGGSYIESIETTHEKGFRLKNPEKVGYLFDGWYLDDQLWNLLVTNRTKFDQSISEVTLFAKWIPDPNYSEPSPVTEPTPSIPTENSEPPTIPTTEPTPAVTKTPVESTPTEVTSNLATATFYLDGYYCGNTNGNLSNLGLAAYDYDNKIHYFSANKTIYGYKPDTDDLFEIITFVDGRPTHLNYCNDALYYINTSSGKVYRYNFTMNEQEEVFDEDANYLKFTSNHIYITYEAEINGEIKNHYKTFRTSTFNVIRDNDFSDVEFMNPTSNRIYYKPRTTLSLGMMNYDGRGKTSLGYLDNYGVESILEMTTYYIDEPQANYLLALEINKKEGLYIYDSETKTLTKLLDGHFHSLNYSNNRFYAIRGTNIYEIDMDTFELLNTYKVPEYAKYIQIINYWIYFGKSDSKDLFRINPDTKEIEAL